MENEKDSEEMKWVFHFFFFFAFARRQFLFFNKSDIVLLKDGVRLLQTIKEV